ncbi:MAG: PAS domain-containing protein [Alphaproteobacteria bacterium]|jgi:hypothetical protein|nr:PAS domain-containing protein [Alphaproteobacteria bacterium]
MHHIIKDALSYWEGLRKGRKTPLRSDFEPNDISELLPDHLFFDVVDGGQDIRFRVIGENALLVFFEDHTGRTMTSLPHVEEDGPMMRNIRQAIKTGEPVRAPIEYVGPLDEFEKLDEILLPLADETGAVTHLLAWIVMLKK